MSYEQNIENYKDSISNIMNSQLVASAQRLAEGGNLANEAREATAQIVGPLALDMLKEGIMHKAGVASAKIGGETVRDQINDAFKGKFKEIADKGAGAAKAKGEELIAQGKGKLQDVVDQARGKATSAIQEGQDALTSAVGTARQTVQATGDRVTAAARESLQKGSTVRDLATSAVQDGTAQARGAAGGFTSGIAPAIVPPKNEDDTVKAPEEPQVAASSGEAPLRYDPRASRRANFKDRIDALSDEDKASVKADYNAGKADIPDNETAEQRATRIAENNKLTDDLVTQKENASRASEAPPAPAPTARDSLAPLREAMGQGQPTKAVTQDDVPTGAGGGRDQDTNVGNLGPRPSTVSATQPSTAGGSSAPSTTAPKEPLPTEEAPSFFSTANIAERSGDALGAAAAGIGAAYAISRPDLSAAQRATTAVEAAAPLVAEKAVGDIVPGAGLIVSGIEDAATPGLGGAAQRAENFGVQTGVLAAQKVGFKAGQAAGRAIQSSRAGQSAAQETDLAGEGGTELTDLAAGSTETAAGGTETAAAGAAAGAGTETAAAGGGLAAELGTDAGVAAATGAESGGLGFIAAGVIGLGAVLASIFAPHQKPKTPTAGPAPNYAIPVESVGLR